MEVSEAYQGVQRGICGVPRNVRGTSKRFQRVPRGVKGGLRRSQGSCSPQERLRGSQGRVRGLRRVPRDFNGSSKGFRFQESSKGSQGSSG